MRLAPCLLLPAAVSAAKSALGSLYLYNEQATSETASLSIKADTARLVIASQLGLDRFHSLAGQDDTALQILNRVTPTQSLFNNQDAASVALVLTSVSEKDLPFAAASAHIEQLKVQDSPSLKTSEKLVEDLAQQSGLQTSLADLRQRSVASYDGPLFRIASTPADLASTFDTLTRQSYNILILNVPSDSTKATYGNYDMPSTLQKRGYQEAPLITDDASSTLSPNTKSGKHGKSGKHSKSKNGTDKHSNSTGPVTGILPKCFASLSACQNMTNSCSGHGSCTLLYTDLDAGDSSRGKCYGCACKAEVRTNKDGTKKTTNWGGPACQKKDVVMPFWLIASFTVFFASVVSWGIGLLYTMGSQELPSVIGAGVSGVPRSK